MMENQVLLFCRRLAEWLSDTNRPGPGLESRAQRALIFLRNNLDAAALNTIWNTVMGESDAAALDARSRFEDNNPVTDDLPGVADWNDAFPDLEE